MGAVLLAAQVLMVGQALSVVENTPPRPHVLVAVANAPPAPLVQV